MIPPIESTGPELALRPAESAKLDSAPSISGPTAGTAADFAAVFSQQVAETGHLQAVAKQKVEALARGASDDLHGTMISVKEAEISMKLVGTVRNRLLDAFHELWRINL